MRTKIAILADTQLYKRLYGEESARVDWYNAFKCAFSQIKERAEDIAAVFILGDVMESNEVGASAAYTLQSVLSDFSNTNIPVAMIMGNHDKEFNSDSTWISVAKLSNPNVIHLSLDTPLEIPVENKIIRVYGVDYAPRDRITQTLHNFSPKQEDGVENWLCLHQALKELAPHKFAWDVTSEQVPQTIDRVFLGHFHNMSEYTSLSGIPFIYPGAIETESFSQTEVPGFILFDTTTNTYTHISTQQREYITYNTEGKLADEILSELTELTQQSFIKFNNRPVVRILYTPETYQEYLKVVDKIGSLTLKHFAIEVGNLSITDKDAIYTGNVSEAGTYQTKEGILGALPDILTSLNIDTAEQEDLLKLISNPETIQDIKGAKFSGAVYKKANV